MKRSLAFIGMLMVGFVAGCGSDPWEIQINQMINLENSVSSKISGLQEDISRATESYKNSLKEETPDKKGTTVIDLEPALKDCKEIKKKCEEMQKTALDIQALPGPISEKRRTDLDDNYRKKILQTFAQCDDRRKKLDESMVQLMELTKTGNPASNHKIEEFKKEFDKTFAEFDGLVRQR